MIKPSRPRYLLLTHLRGMAALIVLMLHLFGVVRPHAHPVFNGVRQITQWGFLGVDFFFVISGYCISMSLTRFSTLEGGSWKFLVDRCLRIYPVFWVTYTVSILIGVFTDIVMRRDPAARFLHSPFEWISHYFLFDIYAGFGPAMDVTWTLVHELTFYLMAAAMLLCASTRILKIGITLLLACGVVLFLIGRYDGGLLAFQFLPEFLCGAIVFFALHSRVSKVVAVSVLLAIPLISWKLQPMSAAGETHVNLLSGYGMQARLSAAALFAMLLIFVHRWDGYLGTRSCFRPLELLGRGSYSLYLIHVPLIAPAANMLMSLSGNTLSLQWLSYLAVSLIALFGAWLLYLLVERPSEQLRRTVECRLSRTS